MNVRLRMYQYCYSNLGAIYAKGLLPIEIEDNVFLRLASTWEETCEFV